MLLIEKKHVNSTPPSFLFFIVIDLHMDEYIGKRASGGVGISKRGSGLIIRDANQEDRSIPCCNRIGCSTRLYAMKSSEVCNEPRKSKCSKPFLRSSSNKWVPGSSSKPSSSTSDLRKIQHELKISTPQKETVAIGRSNIVEQVMVSEPLSPIAITAATYEVGSSSASSNSRSKKKTRQHSSLSNQDVRCGTSDHSTLSSNSSSHTVKSTVRGGLVTKSQKPGFTKFARLLMTDVLPSGCSSSDSSHRKRRDVAKQQGLPDGESSSTRANNATGSFNRRNAWLGPGSSSAGHSANHQPLRRTRPLSAGGNGIASVRSQRTVDMNTISGVPVCESDNSSIITELHSHSQQPELSISELDVSSTSWPSPMELPSISESSNTPDQSEGSGSQTLRPRPAGRLEDGGTRSFRRMSYDRDALRQFHMEGIAEVLFALDRIEHDAELAYEVATITCSRDKFVTGWIKLS
ncbi:hypothetical protein ACLOJK_036838 [Asimina triloba]